MNNSKRLSVHMTRRESLWGWAYFLFYLLALSSLLRFLWIKLGWDLASHTGQARLNFVYFAINFAAVVVIFHKFLWKSLGQIGKRFWGFIQAVILGWVMYAVANWAIAWVLSFLRPGLQNLNNALFQSLAAREFLLTALGTVLLAPLAEECFFRGLVFQGLYRKNRTLAYVSSALLFALLHVMGFAGRYSVTDMCLCLVQYIPAGIALCWAYEKSDTIFAPVLIHLINNAAAMGIFVL